MYISLPECKSRAFLIYKVIKCKDNKDDNIHKNEVQDIRWSDEYWQVDVHLFTYCRVASLFTRYLIAKGTIPESLNSIGQF